MNKYILLLLVATNVLAQAQNNVVGTISGNGNGLTNLNAANLTGAVPSSSLPSGILTNVWQGGIQIGGTAAPTSGLSVSNSANANGVSIETNGSISLSGNITIKSNVVMSSTSGGAVAIGTTANANGELTVKGTGKDAMYLIVDTTDKGIYLQQTAGSGAYARFGFLDTAAFGICGFAAKNVSSSPHAGDLTFWSRDSAGTVQDNRIVIVGTNGFVGIGKTTPTVALDVVGAVTNSLVNSAGGGFSSFATDAAVDGGTGGYTNAYGKTAICTIDGVGVTYTVYNAAGTAMYTNPAVITHTEEILQNGGKVLVTAGTGVTTRARPF